MTFILKINTYLFCSLCLVYVCTVCCPFCYCFCTQYCMISCFIYLFICNLIDCLLLISFCTYNQTRTFTEEKWRIYCVKQWAIPVYHLVVDGGIACCRAVAYECLYSLVGCCKNLQNFSISVSTRENWLDWFCVYMCVSGK